MFRTDRAYIKAYNKTYSGTYGGRLEKTRYKTRMIYIILMAIIAAFLLNGCAAIDLLHKNTKNKTAKNATSAGNTAMGNTSTKKEGTDGFQNGGDTGGDTMVPADSTPVPISIEGKALPILYYHAVGDDVYGLEELFVRTSEFEQQMKYMKDNGYEAITFVNLEEDLKNIEKPFIITFDDGYKNVYTNAYPILKKYGFSAVIYMPSDFINGGAMLTEENIKQMSDIVDFDSHTINHQDLTSLTQAEVEVQLKQSKVTLGNLTGKQSKSIAYPFGAFNQSVLNQASTVYNYGVLAGGGLYHFSKSSLMTMTRIYIYRGLDMATFENKIKGIVK